MTSTVDKKRCGCICADGKSLLVCGFERKAMVLTLERERVKGFPLMTRYYVETDFLLLVGDGCYRDRWLVKGGS